MVTVRRLNESDLSAAVAIIDTCWPDGETSNEAGHEIKASFMLHHPGVIAQKWCGAFVNGELIGVSAWSHSGFASDTYALCWAAVHPDHRHQGINTAMLDYRLTEIYRYHGETPYNVIVNTWDNKMYRLRGFVSAIPNPLALAEGRCILLATFDPPVDNT